MFAIDELTLMDCGGIRGIRRPIARALHLPATVKPKAASVAVILADRGDPAEDAALAEAFHATRNLVLSTELIDEGRIRENPRPSLPPAPAGAWQRYTLKGYPANGDRCCA